MKCEGLRKKSRREEKGRFSIIKLLLFTIGAKPFSLQLVFSSAAATACHCLPLPATNKLLAALAQPLDWMIWMIWMIFDDFDDFDEFDSV